ncbi:hypothetical protein CFK37_08075 [Virgibacillus phasianinus]|uniref:Uncharacterized protein n=1 Tax=Virgibacillus phasianinus TaxID=2017483 RepID=A0A220U2Z2_9BACI|nr:hypothetical protein CFK37_08075 [Virgibacillus phasianinus]
MGGKEVGWTRAGRAGITAKIGFYRPNWKYIGQISEITAKLEIYQPNSGNNGQTSNITAEFGK